MEHPIDVALTAAGTPLVIDGADGLTYTPTANYNGADTFTYTIDDDHGGHATGTVTVSGPAAAGGPTICSAKALVPVSTDPFFWLRISRAPRVCRLWTRCHSS